MRGSDLVTTVTPARRPLRDELHTELRKRIVDGRLRPGSKLVERELADDLGVSRIPLREALRMLESEGFVQVVPRRGVIVRRLTRQDVDELFDIRQALEVLAVSRAAAHATDAEIAELAAILDAGEATVGHDGEATHDAGEEFHGALVRLAHNALLSSMLTPLQGRLQWLFRRTTDDLVVASTHRQIYQAIKDRDVEQAGRLAREHARVNREVALRLLFPADGDDAEVEEADAPV